MGITGFLFNPFSQVKPWLWVGLKSITLKSHDFNLSVQLGGGQGLNLITLTKLNKMIKLV